MGISSHFWCVLWRLNQASMNCDREKGHTVEVGMGDQTRFLEVLAIFLKESESKYGPF